jgi:hypothetical protein
VSSARQCEGCGYDLAGLDPDGACPECARPIAMNNPHRPGSAWQQAPSLDSWLITGLRMCVRPWSSWNEVELEFPRSWNLLVVNVLIASILVGVGMTVGANVGGAARHSFGGVLLAVPVFVVLFLLTMLCTAIVRAATGAGRMAVSAAVAHGSFLWILAAPAALAAMRAPALTVLLVVPAGAVVWLSAAGARRLRYAAMEDPDS